jgi:Inner membrane protein CreD
MSIKRLIVIGLITLGATAAWLTLAGEIAARSGTAEAELSPVVAKSWGPVLQQFPPLIWCEEVSAGLPRTLLQPLRSAIDVRLTYEPRRKGLLRYRTYFVDFKAEYQIKNPEATARTIAVDVNLPSADARYDAFKVVLNGDASERLPENGVIHASTRLEAGQEASLIISYRSAGMNQWTYAFNPGQRVKNLKLAMTTNFADIDIPAGTGSPTSRLKTNGGWALRWDYSDVIGADPIAMGMPGVTVPADVARRVTLFAPLSLLFFFAFLVIVGLREGTYLHPVNYFFLAAGCFAFQLLFVYLVDLLPLTLAFLIAAAVSLLLVNGYLWLAAGPRFAKISAAAQFTYMVLFSYSFFFRGLTGITVTLGAIATLGVLMAWTAKIDWNEALTNRSAPLRAA